jgi:poly-gamma-glutamate synthesis protein (capsule biosynthesis protein)
MSEPLRNSDACAGACVTIAARSARSAIDPPLTILVALGLCGPLVLPLSPVIGQKALAADRAPFATMYSDPKRFLEAMRQEHRPFAVHSRITGISVPHHLVAADLIARGFRAAAGSSYDRVIILSPDHFNRSRRPMATTPRDMHTVFGLLQNDRAATSALLETDDLFDDSDLFAQEHGISAVLPFIRHFWPDAKIVPIAISYGASRANCDRVVTQLEKLIGARTLVVQSTDYSHYLSADAARQRDQETLNVIAADDVDAVLRLVQPAHMDSRAAQYIQMQLQDHVFKSSSTVVANRNSAEYGAVGARTTSYIVTVYTERPPTGAELRYQDQQLFYFGGDTFIGRWFTAPLADGDVAASIIRQIKLITGGSPMVVNLEGVLMDEPPEGIGTSRHVMHASLAIPILRALNVKVAGLANNHSFDLGSAGVEESRAILQRSGIAPLGHQEIVDVGPFRLVGLNFIGRADYRDYPVVKENELGELCRLPARPPLIAFVHWGAEYTSNVGAPESAAAQAMQACGVSAIVGAHPHLAAPRIEAMQGGEYQLTYSLGNLLFDQTGDHSSGAILELRVFKQGTYAARLIRHANLFDFGIEQLQIKQGHPIRLPETNAERSRAD